jgi:hypothetical protein
MGRIGLRVMNRSERDARVVALEHHTWPVRVQPKAQAVTQALRGNLAVRLPCRGERRSIENCALPQGSPKAVHVGDCCVGTAVAAAPHWKMEDIALVASSV